MENFEHRKTIKRPFFYNFIHRNVNFSPQGGYVAFMSVLIFASVMLAIGISVTLLAISEGQMSLAGKKSEEAVDFVESCIEDALLRLKQENTIPTQIPLPQGTCDVSIDSQVGGSWTFTVSGERDGYYKSIQIQARRDTEVSVESWQQIQ